MPSSASHDGDGSAHLLARGSNVAFYEGSIIDAHVHFDPPTTGIDTALLADVIDAITAAGVEKAVFMPTPNEGRNPNHELGDEQRRMLQDLDDPRIDLFAGSNYVTYWLNEACQNGYAQGDLDAILDRLSTDMGSGPYRGIGEIGLLHFEKIPGQAVLMLQANFEPYLAVVDRVAELDAWFDLHAEPVDPKGVSYEEHVFGGLELILSQHPDLKIVLSHTAMTNPTNLERIFLAYPNVLVNFKIITDHEKWKNLEPLVNENGEIYEDWAELMEAWPERFVVGTDYKFGRDGSTLEGYKDDVDLFRWVLGSLDEDAAQQIARTTAMEIAP